MPMVEVAYEILKTTEPEESTYVFRDLMTAVASVKQLKLNDEQFMKLSVHLYTDLNIDGRFASTQSRTWGLKSWKSIKNEVFIDIDDTSDDEDTLDIAELGADSAVSDPVAKDFEDADYKVADDTYSEDDDIDNKPLDEEITEIPGLEPELSIEDMKDDEDRDDDFDDDPDGDIQSSFSIVHS